MNVVKLNANDDDDWSVHLGEDAFPWHIRWFGDNYLLVCGKHHIMVVDVSKSRSSFLNVVDFIPATRFSDICFVGKDTLLAAIRTRKLKQ